MPKRKKFASKPKFKGNNYVRVKKDTGVTEKRQPLSEENGESSCVKHNLSGSNKKIRSTSVNTEIKVGGNNFCKRESTFTQDGNIVVGINLLCIFIQRINNCKLCGGSISFLKIHQRGEIL
jgi:hypothetical protein